MKLNEINFLKKYDTKNLNIEDIKNILYIFDNINKIPYHISNINSGIGDILIFKNNFPNEKIYWNIKHLLDYKPFPSNLKNVAFNIQLLKKLFNKTYIYYSDNINIKTYSLLKLNYLPNLINLFDTTKLYNFKYIIFHTKLRFAKSHSTFFIKNIKLKLCDFFTKFKAKYKIILLGERKIEENLATKIIPTITTIYDECLLLKNNNDVIDLTEEYMYNTPEISRFERDLGLINNAEFNIGIGHGGQFCLNLFFSKKSIYYCPPKLINFEIKNPNVKIITNIDSFIHQCEQSMS